MSTTTIAPINATAQIYVLWHPEFRSGSEFARVIFDWFRLPSGFGIPVLYRSAPRKGQKGAPPPDIPTGDGVLKLIVLLADEHMVADQTWRAWLDKHVLDEGKPRRGMVIYPVALHRTAYNLPPGFRALNFISLQDSTGRGTELTPASIEEQKQRLLKRLTEAFARLLIGRGAAGDERPKVKIFISHAKADGTDKAKRIRDYIYRETQLTAFFDENDIALGSQFAGVLNTTLENESAAMIVVQGDRYASRPWCRREVQLFRKPRRLSDLRYAGSEWTSAANRSQPTARRRKDTAVWTSLPILLINAMQGEADTFSIPELGSAPTLRWRENDESRYVDMLLRDCILRTFHLETAKVLAKGLSDQLQKDGARAIINWTPDPMSISLLVARAKSDGAVLKEIVYPTGRISGLEIDLFEDLFPKTCFRTYRDLQRPSRS